MAGSTNQNLIKEHENDIPGQAKKMVLVRTIAQKDEFFMFLRMPLILTLQRDITLLTHFVFWNVIMTGKFALEN